MVTLESCSKEMVTFELNKVEIDKTEHCVENTESIQTIQLQDGVNAAVILLKSKTGKLKKKIKNYRAQFVYFIEGRSLSRYNRRFCI